MTVPAQLNHYRILGPLGSGGMGEVYLAEDTRLHRKVALKVLSRLMAADPERRQRFEREAQAVAALNHPNIVTIYSVEEADGVPFLTMELVEGRPLSDMIPAGGLPLDALLRVGIGVSDAIATAHQRGITHRDLKPGNVMVAPDGRVKVLDFGLAKLREAELDGEGVTRMPSNDLTGEGRIIGTVAYMSPEQAEGKSVDARSDIFSLGVVLHELSTGERPFKGDTNVSVISSILKDTPSSITDLNPRLPVELGKIIRRCLSKDPSRRYQTAIDLRNDLEELKQEVDSGVTLSMSGVRTAPVARHRRTGRAVLLTVLAIALVGGAAYGLNWLRRGGESGSSKPFEPARFTRLTSTGNAFLAAISANGRYVVHIKNDGANASLWVRQTATTSDVQIVPPAPVRFDGITHAPDGDYVYYVTYSLTGGIGTLFKVPVLGGPSQRILEDVDSRVSFSPDGQRFAFTRGAPGEGRAFLMSAAADGSDVRQVAMLQAPEQFQLNGPAWSPDGRTIVASAQSLTEGPHLRAYVVDAVSGHATHVGGRWTAMGDIEWMPDGRSFVMAAADIIGTGTQIWQVTYPQGRVTRVTNDLNTYTGVSLSADASTLVTIQAETASTLWVAPQADLSRARQITRGRGRGDGLTGLAWTPDGRLVFGSFASGRPEIWIMNADGTGGRQLTSDPDASMAPAVTHDGRYIVFQRFSAKGMYLWRMALDGSEARQITTGGSEFQPVTGPDASVVFFSSPVTGQPIAHRVGIDGGASTKLSDGFFRPTDVSADGRTLLGTGWDEKERRSAVATLPVEGGMPRIIPHVPIGRVAWAPGGQGITFANLEQGWLALFNLPLAVDKPKPKLLVTLDENLFGIAWSRDGAQLAMARGLGTSDVVLISRK